MLYILWHKHFFHLTHAHTLTDPDDFYSLFPEYLEIVTNTTDCTEVNLATGDGYEYSESFSLLLTATSDFIVDVVQNMTEVTILNSDSEFK